VEGEIAMSRSQLTRRSLGIAGAGAAAALAARDEPAAAKCRKRKVVQPDIIHVNYSRVCVRPTAQPAGRGIEGPFTLEFLIGAGGGVWYDADNVPVQIGDGQLVPSDGPIVYQVSGIEVPVAGAGVAGSLDRIALSFRATGSHVNAVFELFGDIIAGPRPTAEIEIGEASVVGIPEKS